MQRCSAALWRCCRCCCVDCCGAQFFSSSARVLRAESRPTRGRGEERGARRTCRIIRRFADTINTHYLTGNISFTPPSSMSRFASTALLVSAVISCASAFVPSSSTPPTVPSHIGANTALGMAADTSAYDIVKVDLDDGRDYPIYIGAEFDEAEGEC